LSEKLVKIAVMKQLIIWLKKHWLLIAISIFAISRVYIFLNPPAYVRYFEEYANIWYYGWPPYLKHWFEYPPATIPFISGPLLLDLHGVGKYRLNFRVMILCFDALLFGLILRVLSKLKFPPLTRLVNVLFYVLLTVKAKDFMYENLDLLFAITLFVPAVAGLLTEKGKSWIQWMMYWLGTGVKLVNVPLGLAYLLDNTRSWKQKILIVLVTGALIWALPIAIFRSSLSVILVYHKDRTLQVESFPSLLVRGVNLFTKSETIYFSQYKSFDLKGPISKVILPISTVALLLGMLILIIYILRNRDQADQPVFLMKTTLLFIFIYFITNKVFSTPYHLWYLPLLTVYPYKNNKERAFFFSVATIFLAVATSPIPSIEVFKGFFLDSFLPILTGVPAIILLLWGTIQLKTKTKEVAHY